MKAQMRQVAIALFLIFSLCQAENVGAQSDAKAGAATFREYWCFTCHGAKGEGGFGPDLAGRQLSFDQFKHAIRQPWGVMPAFTEQQLGDRDIGNIHTYFSSLPRVASPGPWRTVLPPGAPIGLTLLAGTVGCAQCHGAAVGDIRAAAGAVDGDFEWFKGMTYEHATAMPAHRQRVGAAAGPVRMGAYSRMRVPESTLQEIWRYIANDLKLRARGPGAAQAGDSVGLLQPRCPKHRSRREGTDCRRHDNLAAPAAWHNALFQSYWRRLPGRPSG